MGSDEHPAEASGTRPTPLAPRSSPCAGRNLSEVTRKFFVRTFGCQMNEHDSERIAAELGGDGMVRTDQLEEADVVVLNTCCIRENADNKLYGHLGHLKSLRDRRPGMQIAVGGCLAQKDRDAILERAPHVDAVFGTHNVARAASLLREARESGHSVLEVLDVAAEGDHVFPTALPVRPELSHAAWVTIQVGCDNSCAFCIVPSVRGPEQSRAFGDLLTEVEALAAAGIVELTLLGQNVNSYGRDLTTGLRPLGDERSAAEQAHLAGHAWVEEGARRPRPLFADLLRAVGAVEGIRRVRFTSPHPKDLRPETIAAMAETPAVCEQLHLPLQSGSDRVLAAMRRGYTTSRYFERLAAARAAIEDLAVTTDLIVGFPGETEQDFEETLEFVAEARYDSAFTFIFSPRPGTRAATMEDQYVPAETISERFARLAIVIERSALQANRARVGRLEEALVEGPSRKDPAVL
ncbi:MAG: miaB, partial [Acidimicrobiaceae bacterium]|nr:miaB [Acidimicrobiaceae bacterium]